MTDEQLTDASTGINGVSPITELPEPPEERLADLLVERPGPRTPRRQKVVALLRQVGHADRVAYRTVAGVSTPLLDMPLRRLSNAANWSKLWLAIAAALGLFGGSRGRRAAITGVAAIGATSLLVNQPMKRAYRRRRPDRELHGVPEPRWVTMPTSTSFPSGHSASAAAFAVAVGSQLPAMRIPLRVAGGLVAFSRVYVGVHYPGDVIVGVSCGAVIGRVASSVANRITLWGNSRVP